MSRWTPDVRTGLLCAGVGLLMISTFVPLGGADLTDDGIGLLLLAAAGHHLRSRPLLVAGVLAAVLRQAEYGGMLAYLHEYTHEWWYAAAAAATAMEGLVVVLLGVAVARTGLVPRRRRLLATVVLAAYAGVVALRVVLLVLADPGTLVAGFLLQAGQAVVVGVPLLGAVVCLVARERTSHAFPAPAPALP
ncbi:MAG: hypothetical protein Q8Q02_01420 [Nocardioides sp.]|nr:hypothetical protein [Nocardioides sp.]